MATEKLVYLEESAKQFHEFSDKVASLLCDLSSRIDALERANRLVPEQEKEYIHEEPKRELDVPEKSNSPVMENLINLIKGGQA